MTCEYGKTFNTSLGAMWVGKSSYNHDNAEECCSSKNGSLASLTTANTVTDLKKKIQMIQKDQSGWPKPYWLPGKGLFRLGVNITKGVGKWNNGENFNCEFCELKF